VVLGLLLVIVLGAAVAPRVIDMRYLNIPIVHPWPPAGYQQNPFNPSDRSDVIASAEAARVQSDLLADGDVETAAAATGDDSKVTQADTGRSLDSIRHLLATNRSFGVLQRTQTHLNSITVGHLADPNDPQRITWCVEERGSAILSFLARDTGKVVRTSSLQFRIRFWLVKQSGRYVIADTLVMS